MDTLGFGCILPTAGRIGDFHPLERMPTGHTKKVSDEMFISPRYLANIENKGQHPSLQIFFELMLRYNISVDQFLLETPPEKNTQRRQLDALLDGMSDTGIRIVSATAKEIAEVETEGR